MNYTKTNPFRLIPKGGSIYTDKWLATQNCHKCGWVIYITVEDYYYRESINHNSTQAWLHKHCFQALN